MFKIKAIVSLPRNVFIDTPTLTSLLFAQKKTRDEIRAWDEEWQKNYDSAAKAFKDAKTCVTNRAKNLYKSANEVQQAVIGKIKEFVNLEEWIVKKGKNAEIMPIIIDYSSYDVDSCVEYYADFLKSASIEKFILRYAFEKTSEACDQEFATFVVDEVGYKLSKRKEKSRPNQLCEFVGVNSKKKVLNLHLGEESTEIKFDITNPQTVLDYIKKEINWE